MPLTTAEEAEFYSIQEEYFRCRNEKICSENLVWKEPVGDHGWYYTPTAEFVGSRYAGIVVVAARPAMPKSPSLNPILREKIISYLSGPSVGEGRAFNNAMAEFILNFLFVKTGEAQFSDWGLVGRIERIAFLNIYKCRLIQGERDAITPPYILEPCVRTYLDRQMKVLKPKLIIYHWPYVHAAVTRLIELDEKFDPAYGAEVCIGPDDSFPVDQRANINISIKEKVDRIVLADLSTSRWSCI